MKINKKSRRTQKQISILQRNKNRQNWLNLLCKKACGQMFAAKMQMVTGFLLNGKVALGIGIVQNKNHFVLF